MWDTENVFSLYFIIWKTTVDESQFSHDFGAKVNNNAIFRRNGSGKQISCITIVDPLRFVAMVTFKRTTGFRSHFQSIDTRSRMISRGR